MRFDFVHCHGSGNDFPLIDARGIALRDEDWAIVARALADRRGPVGGDGLLLLGEGDGDCAFSMVMRNSDGSEAETCLNGLRCVARAGFAALAIDAARVRLKTSVAEVAREPDVAPGVYGVREVAGPASLDAGAWPLGGHVRLVEAPLAELSSSLAFTAVAMPNPHLVAFVEAVDEAALCRAGEACEAAPAWVPNRANVSFAEMREGVSGTRDLFVQTFERGVGLTDSCGSAMAASTYAACLTGRVAWDAPITVFNRGGLVRAQASADAMVTIIGNATWEYAGAIDVDLSSGAASGLVVHERFGAEVAAWELAAGKPSGERM
ncbi:diaminopimelate epimerase [Sphingomonas sp.]|jgi:diaminopimelate epimerase|uniref:diaminopimelate epimerase n=1 Tax=Sphingomonas sp. TaxID=28214 RepID=UPI002ED9855D